MNLKKILFCLVVGMNMAQASKMPDEVHTEISDSDKKMMAFLREKRDASSKMPPVVHTEISESDKKLMAFLREKRDASSKMPPIVHTEISESDKKLMAFLREKREKNRKDIYKAPLRDWLNKQGRDPIFELLDQRTSPSQATELIDYLKEYPDSVDARYKFDDDDITGTSTLNYAIISYDSPEIIKLLLKYGANPNEVIDNQGYPTLLHILASKYDFSSATKEDKDRIADQAILLVAYDAHTDIKRASDGKTAREMSPQLFERVDQFFNPEQA